MLSKYLLKKRLRINNDITLMRYLVKLLTTLRSFFASVESARSKKHDLKLINKELIGSNQDVNDF